MPINWQDGASGGTPLSAANLNRLAVVADIGTTGTPTGDAVKATAAAQVNDANVATQVAGGTQTRAALKAAYGSLRRRDLPPLSVANPAAMSTPPTFATAGPGGPTPIASARHVEYNDQASVALLGCAPVFQSGAGGGWQNQINGQGGSGAQPWAIEFDYHGADLAVWFRCAAANLSTFWVWVDGVPATAAPQVSSAAAANSLHYYRINFSGTALRRVRIFMAYADFCGIDVGPIDSVAATAKRPFSVAWLGDSWTAETGAATSLQGFAFTASRLLGVECYEAGISGSGYVNAGSGWPYGDTNRVSKLVAAAPDYIVITGSVNDSAATPAAVQSAASALYSTLATQLPATKLLVVGVEPNTAMATTGNNVANNTAIKTAAQAAPNVLAFIDPYTEGWLTGTGHVGGTAGDGNRDVLINTDGIHPTQAGHDYFARRIANRIAATIAA